MTKVTGLRHYTIVLMELNWNDVIKIASGKDEDGIPRSGATLAVDKIIENNKLEKVKEVFLRDAVITCTLRGGVAAITMDFQQLSHIAFDQSVKISREWLENLDNSEFDDQKLTLTLVPYSLCGQVIVIFDGLSFMDSYSFTKDNKTYYRLILVFDNQYTSGLVTDEIDYRQIQQKIAHDLERYEEQLDAELHEALEEERKAKEEENVLNMEMQKKLNNPLEHINKESRTNENLREEAEEDSHYRFVEEDQPPHAL